MYNDYLTVNKNFQTAINLELDLNNEQKIDEYIPTSDICDVIKKYIKSILGLSKDRSTLLVGPYGKGKSFLLLILTYLVSNNKHTPCYQRLTEKIRKVDKELYELILRLDKENVSLLPVIINSNYDNITQSFQIALNEALNREGITGIIPKTSFDVCVDLIDKWNGDETIRENIVNRCVQINKTDLDALKSNLKNYSYEAYSQFETLYNCVNVGLKFNPLVNDDITKIYKDTASALAKSKTGYKGFFIIFDEFSKFLESTSNNLMKDLKIVQDIAELCSRSNKDSQLHLICVTHKPMSLYQSSKKQPTAYDSFKAVEGRFKEIRFNRSIEENYQIISSALIKSNEKKYEKLVNNALKENKDFFNSILNLNIFDKDFANDTLFRGCYPLNPLTVYFLIRISEYCAQNERTLFTFLSDTDDNSFNSFLRNNENGMFNVDKIYDYFLNVFQSEETNSIRNICYRCESVLTKVEDPLERKIIKVLAIILMIDDTDTVPPTVEVISCSLDTPIQRVNEAIDSLINNGYIRKNLLNSNLSFALSITKEIDTEYALYNATKFNKAKIADSLNKIDPHPYFLPRRYNENNKITRFFKNEFMTDTDFLSKTSFYYYFDENYLDGVVISLINTGVDPREIEKQVKRLDDKRIVVKFPHENVDDVFYNLVSFYECLDNLKNRKGLDDVTATEIDFSIEETVNDLRGLLSKYYDNESDYTLYSIIKDKEETFSDLLSDTMEKCFSYKLIFNNELMNKKTVTTQYQKAINHVIDYLLNRDQEFPYSETSPEYSVKYSALDSNENDENFLKIIEEIKEAISSGKNKIVVNDILNKYRKMPYGIRDGVLPVLFAKALSELSGNAILYYQRKEIDLDANNLVKAINGENAASYLISYSKKSKEQDKYLERMMKLFDVPITHDFRRDVYRLADSIRKYFIGLPQIERSSTLSNNILSLDENTLNYKSLFMSVNLNPYESIFTEPADIFGTKNYDDIFSMIEKIMLDVNVVDKYKDGLIWSIRNIFDITSKESLRSGFNNFLLKTLNGAMPILNDLNKEIYDVVAYPSNYDDYELLNQISRAITNQYVDDWDKNNCDKVIDALKKFKDEIVTCSKASNMEEAINVLLDKTTELSEIGELLRNNLESDLDEFASSVSSDEKRAVLIDLLKKYL